MLKESRDQNREVLNVFHACNQDSEALKFQFDVVLQNVFDTQKQWNKSIGNYWEIRPLTQEMIEYACSDVRVLVPEVYEHQKRLLEEQDATSLFGERVHEKIHYPLDDNIKQRRSDRILQNAKTVIQKIAQQFPAGVDYESIQDEDFKSALTRHWTEEEIQSGMTSSVQTILYDAVMHQLREIENEMDRDEDDFNTEASHNYFLYSVKTYPRANIKELATKLFERFQTIVFKDMTAKYTSQTPLYYLREQEKWLLKNIRIKNAREERQYNPILVSLHYKRNAEDFKQFQRDLATKPLQMKVTAGFYTFLGYQVKSTHIPAFVRTAATELKQAIDRAGKNPLPPRKPRPAPRYDFNYDDDEDDDFC